MKISSLELKIAILKKALQVDGGDIPPHVQVMQGINPPIPPSGGSTVDAQKFPIFSFNLSGISDYVF